MRGEKAVGFNGKVLINSPVTFLLPYGRSEVVVVVVVVATGKRKYKVSWQPHIYSKEGLRRRNGSGCPQAS